MTTATLRNWGGSVALPIPRKLLGLLALGSGSEVALKVEGNRLLIEPVKPTYTLEQLMTEQKALNLAQDSEWLEFEELPSESVK